MRFASIILIAMAASIALCLLLSMRFINLQSTITLAVFNTLFASLIFQLKGAATIKLGLLAGGNAEGLFWNFVFNYFSSAGTQTFGRIFDAFYTLIFPVLNLMWIVPFWALSLSFLPKAEKADPEVNRRD